MHAPLIFLDRSFAFGTRFGICQYPEINKGIFTVIEQNTIKMFTETSTLEVKQLCKRKNLNKLNKISISFINYYV